MKLITSRSTNVSDTSGLGAYGICRGSVMMKHEGLDCHLDGLMSELKEQHLAPNASQEDVSKAEENDAQAEEQMAAPEEQEATEEPPHAPPSSEPPAVEATSMDQGPTGKDAYATRLSKQLQHYRSWVASVHLRVQHMNPKAIQNAKRLYIGNLPPTVTEEDLCAFLNELMQQTGGQVGTEPAVLQCHLTQERNFAFAEFRSVEEASNAMGLDGVAWKDTFLKIRRPSNYDLATSLMLGPITPDPTMDVSFLNLSKPLPEESPNKLFVGGLPCEWPEQAVRLILEPWGAIKAFNLVMDKATGNSKGYAFCEFVDEVVTDSAIAGLNGQRAGTKTLTVKRAADGARQALGSNMGPQDSSGISPIPTPMSQPSSFDDTGPGARGANPGLAGLNLHMGPGTVARKSITNQSMAAPGQSQGLSSYMMAPQQMGMMMSPSMSAAHGQQPYGTLGMARPMAQSHDSHIASMQHMATMQPQMMQTFMPQPHPMHINQAMGAMMMPGGMVMQSPNHSFHSSVDHMLPVSGTGNRSGTSKMQHSSGSQMRNGSALSGGGSGSWSSPAGLVPGRPGSSQMQG